MNAVFDTLAYSKKLQAAGVPEALAEAQAEALAEVAIEKFATKTDIVEIKKEFIDVRKDINNVKQELKNDMVALEERLSYKVEKSTYQLTIRLGSLLAAGILLIGSLHKLFN